MVYSVPGLINLALNVYLVIVLVRVIGSWIPPAGPGPWAQVQSLAWSLTEPLLAPIRRLLHPYQRGVSADFSPMVLLFLLYLAARLLTRALPF